MSRLLQEMWTTIIIYSLSSPGCKFQKYIEDHHYDTYFLEEDQFSPPPPLTGEQSEDGLDTDDLFSDSYSENYDTGGSRV